MDFFWLLTAIGLFHKILLDWPAVTIVSILLCKLLGDASVPPKTNYGVSQTSLQYIICSNDNHLLPNKTSFHCSQK